MIINNLKFPYYRGRRLRSSPAIRQMAAEHHLHASDLIAPLFVIEGEGQKEPIASMPGYYRFSLDLIAGQAEKLHKLGIPAVLLFAKVPDEKKDNLGSESLNPDGLMQRTVKTLKGRIPELCVMTDVALDPYSSDGHDGIVKDGYIMNDPTLEVLSKMSVSHAEAGADFVAPSDMMDGRIQYIREALEERSFHDTGIMAYSAKYASCFYGPFRDALDSAPGFGDKKTYQMDPPNVKEAIREAKTDENEGADIIMVKPGIPYLDVVRAISESVSLPVASYHVSGEYAMIKAAAEKGWLDEQAAVLESLIAFKRAGCRLIATYFAEDVAHWL
ncbi:MAG: porphobilinogen synthase [Balneolales bacterium]